MKGYLEVYTGDGKGKTTAALGLAVRALGAGLKVYIAQFVKGMKYSELKTIKRLGKSIAIKQFGRGCFIRKKPITQDIDAARKGLTEAGKVIKSGKYDIVILDEANIAVYYGLFSAKELIDTIRSRPSHVEIVVTGRRAHPALLKEADLVTEMKERKHYYTKGIAARVGIEK